MFHLKSEIKSVKTTCYLFLVSGYTPTFRNEATHPLKAPTESTLGMQINDELTGRTKSNIPKQETYFSGGKHFEYMLLNDSNVLLTSLQNDGPFDSASEQPLIVKNYSFSNPDGKNVHYKPVIKLKSSLSASQSDRIHSQINIPVDKSVYLNDSKLEFSENVSTFKLYEKNNTTDKVNISKVNIFNKLPLNFRKLPDISSTTKLFSKRANSSEEKFASFTSPLVKPLFNGDNLESVLQRDSTDLNVGKQVYDYDDSFTNLLILNGILKPSNFDTKFKTQNNFHKSSDTASKISNMNPSMKDINRIMDNSIASMIRNNTDQNTVPSSHAIFPSNSGAVLEILTEVEVSTTVPTNKSKVNEDEITDLKNQNNLNGKEQINTSFKLNDNKHEAETSSFQPMQHVEPTTKEHFNLVLKADEFATKFMSTEFNSNDFTSIQSSTEKTGTYNESNATQPDRMNVVPVYNSKLPNITEFGQLYRPTEQKTILSTSINSAHNDVSNENPLTVKTYTDSTTFNGNLSLIPLTKNTLPLRIDSNNKGINVPNNYYTSTEKVNFFGTTSTTLKTGEQFLDVKLLPLTKFNSNIQYSKETLSPLTRYHSHNDFHDIQKKNYRGNENSLYTKSKASILSSQDFINITYTIVENLFYSVAKYCDTFIIKDLKPRSRESKVTVTDFQLINLTSILDKYRKQNKFIEFKVDARNKNAYGNFKKMREKIWIDLDNNRNVSPDSSLEYLFSLREEEKDYDEKENDGYWFILLDENPIVAEVQDRDFLQHEIRHLAIILHLVYHDIRIKTIFVLPSTFTMNIKFPTNSLHIQANKELKIKRVYHDDNILSSTERSNKIVKLLERSFHVQQLFSLIWSEQNYSLRNLERERNKKHDDIELYIFVLLGAVCTFTILSLLFYGVYRLIQKDSNHFFFKVPLIFRDRYHYREKISECSSESLNVIFSENFNRKYTTTSWLDNSHHSSSILQASSEVPPTIFIEKRSKIPDFHDRDLIVNSPRLNKENKLNVLGCRPSCVLLPPTKTYQSSYENEDRFFENPNYDRDSR